MVFGMSLAAQAEMITIYGPVYVAKHKKHEDRHYDKHEKNEDRHHAKHKKHGDEDESKFVFYAPVAGAGKIIIKNGTDSDRKHKKRRVASAEIELNDVKVGSEKDFNKRVGVITYDVDILTTNELEVEVKSCKRCELEITVLGPAPVPPPVPSGGPAGPVMPGGPMMPL